jgi:hypothetical protein
MTTIYHNVFAVTAFLLISACGPSNQSIPTDTVNKDSKPVCTEEFVSLLNEVELYRRNFVSIYTYKYLIKAFSANAAILENFSSSRECIVRDVETDFLMTINYNYLLDVENTLRATGQKLIRQECSENTAHKQACRDLRVHF